MDRIWDNYPPLTPGPSEFQPYSGWEDDEDPFLYLTEEDVQMMREQDLKALEEAVNE